MKQIRAASLFFCLLLFPLRQIAQELNQVAAAQPVNDDAGILFLKERYMGPLIHSRGWGFQFRYGNHLTGTIKRMFDVDFVTLRHPKEIKLQNQFVERGRSYRYGKLNSVFLLRTGYGLQKEIHGKFLPNSVEVRLVGFLGSSLAIQKPIYLEVEYNLESLPRVEKYDPERHTPDNIIGQGPILRGLGEIRPRVGAYAKFGLAFEYAGSDQVVRGLETGFILDYHPGGIDLMAFNEAEILTPTVYVSLLFGKKWN